MTAYRILLAVLIPALAPAGIPVTGPTPLAGQAKHELTAGGLVMDNGVVSLRISPELAILPALVDGERHLRIAAEPTGKSAFHLVCAGSPTRHRPDWSSPSREEIEDGRGRGTRFSLSAPHDPSAGGPRVDAILRFTFYDNFPDVVTAGADFINRGTSSLPVEMVVAPSILLDRRQLDPAAQAWDFASYQGAAYGWGQDYALIRLNPGFERKNFIGLYDREDREGEGGGTPIVDFWAPECGLALACLEDKPSWVSLPVKVTAGGQVETAVTFEPDENLGHAARLAPGDTLRTVETAIILHRLDFHDPIRTYSRILRADGVPIPETSPPSAYRAYWKTWGYGLDINVDTLYRDLPQLHRLGIDWYILDDGWFRYYGDWDPSPEPGKFPGGDRDMRAFVDRLHREGFKASVWWCPVSVSPESRLAQEHPEWLVMARDGSFPRTERGNYQFCPACPEALDHVESLVRRLMTDYGFDGLYLDGTDNTAFPPCFNPAHNHASPLESYEQGARLFERIHRTAVEINPQAPIELCICGVPHDPFKMPWYNIATTSDPLGLLQMRRRVKLEKAFRSPSFCVTDCLQVPIEEWEGWSLPEAFEHGLGAGAQLTMFYRHLPRSSEKTWKRFIDLDRGLALSGGDYLNLYDLAWDRPEAHAIRKGDRMYYGFFADWWPVTRPLRLRGLESGVRYRVRNYLTGEELGVVDGAGASLRKAFKEFLLLEAAPLK